MDDLDVHLPGIRDGDARAFARWVAGSETRLRLSLRGFAEQVDVEAVVQETLLRIWQVAPRFEHDGKPNGLLRLAIRAARNLAISEVRKRRATCLDPALLAMTADLEAVSVPEVQPDPLLREAIRRCRDTLPSKPRGALVARMETEGNEPDQVLAERLGMTLNTFLQNFSRARRFLIDCLHKLGIEPLVEAP
jgi:RNA polymerase sigma-70 factor (ECF subfamily)